MLMTTPGWPRSQKLSNIKSNVIVSHARNHSAPTHRYKVNVEPSSLWWFSSSATAATDVDAACNRTVTRKLLRRPLCANVHQKGMHYILHTSYTFYRIPFSLFRLEIFRIMSPFCWITCVFFGRENGMSVYEVFLPSIFKLWYDK